mgnify:CR=1 FL=1
MVITVLPIVILLHVLPVLSLFLRNVDVELKQLKSPALKNSFVHKNAKNSVLVVVTDVTVAVVMGNILHVQS